MSAPGDLLNFIPADVFFKSVKASGPPYKTPIKAVKVESSASTHKANNPLRYAAHVTLQGVEGDVSTHCLVQFVTPQIWRIRYNPKFTAVEDYPDANSKNTEIVTQATVIALRKAGTGKQRLNSYQMTIGFSAFPSRLLMSDDTYNQDPKSYPPTKTAIELWGLYSYNLRKATYKGLNRLKGRENKRNFFIGRGSLTGMHRFAGLWTGDNGSSWDFWRILVAQVIALGYSGMTIAGVDIQTRR
ncbi:hypothetical protein SGCOL_001753 [Colletotrichum sp. CLE4]